MPSYSRREVLGILSAGALAVRGADTPLSFSRLDHLEFFVSDVQKSAAFYARVFGNAVLKNNRTSRRYVELGGAYMAIDTGQQIRVDHICVGIPGFDIAGVHTQLQQLGIEYRDYPSGKDLSVGEADSGVRLQLASDNGWNALTTGTASPETLPLDGEAIFRPLGLEHILLNVADPERSVSFYQMILGPVAQRGNNRIWFQVGSSRIGLLKTPDDQRAGVNHFCVTAKPFDYDSARKRLAQTGAKVETPELTGEPSAAEFRDLDGYLVQVVCSDCL